MDVQRAPDPVLVVISAIFSNRGALDAALERLSSVLGNVRLVAEEQPFTWTEYYKKEMGSELRRQFLVGNRLAASDLLADLKRFTNRIEVELAREDGSRQINLDPGLLSLGNFVLATTKNNSHRIYLRDGIFAEVTLRFIHGSFTPVEWTYPDYRAAEIRDLLRGLRAEYQESLRGEPELIDTQDVQQEVGP